MRKHQVYYPETSPISHTKETQAQQQRFSMGNGFILHEILQSTDSLAALRSLGRDLGPSGKLLFSRETFMRELAGDIGSILKLAINAGLGKLHILLFVRDPLDHAYSVYCEMVKAHGLSDTFSAWLPRYSLPAALERFLEAISSAGGCQLTVYNYSRNPEAIVHHVGLWLGGPSGLEGLQPLSTQLVNRSLSHDELRLMRLLNRTLGKKAARIGRSLAELPAPPQATHYRVPVEIQQQFLARIEPTVARLNAHLPTEAALRLKLLPSHCSIDGPESAGDAADCLMLMPNQLAVALNVFDGSEQGKRNC